MRDIPIRHSFDVANIDGDTGRGLSVKVDSSYNRLDDLMHVVFNNPDELESLSRDPIAYLSRYGVNISGPGADRKFLHLPDPAAIRSALAGNRPLLDPGVAIEPRRAGALGLVEVLIAITVAVV